MSSPNSVKNPGFAVRCYVNWGEVYAQAGSCDQAFLLEAGPTFCSLSWRSRSLHLMMFPERVRRLPGHRGCCDARCGSEVVERAHCRGVPGLPRSARSNLCL